MEKKTNNNKIKWYWHRLRSMSCAEIIHRAKKYILITVIQCMSRSNNAPSFTSNGKAELTKIKINFHTESQIDYIRAADRLINDGFDIFKVKLSFEDIFNCWNCDFKNQVTAPLLNSLKYNYKDKKLVGDIKYLWEINRHLIILPIAQAYYFSNENKYLDVIRTAISTWIYQCPYLKGPNWTSSLELAIRLINWCLVWKLIDGSKSPIFQGEEGKQLLKLWLITIYRHCHFIKNNLSRYSSANNHLIGELAGLFISSNIWPYWDDSEKWKKLSYRLLLQEIEKQNTSDGVNKEQAIAYQQFVLDFLIISGMVGHSYKIKFPDNYWKIIESMIAFIGSMIDNSNNIPMIGDADDGFVFHLSSDVEIDNYVSLLSTGAMLFNRREFIRNKSKTDQKTQWLIGLFGVPDIGYRGGQETLEWPKQSYSQGGYYITGKDFFTPKEIKCIIDCGPLGYLSIAAHGHADALSMYLSVGGREILIDPGTYAYHRNKRWRNYFRGTAAHNTIRVDGFDQSRISGNFMWSHKANATCNEFRIEESKDTFIGYHDGYSQLKDPVIHERKVEFNKNDSILRVSDAILCKSDHSIERFFHFSEQCDVRIENNKLIAKNDSVKVAVSAADDESSKLALYYGDEDMPMGWVSRHYDLKVPTYSAIFTNDICGNSVLQTDIKIYHND